MKHIKNIKPEIKEWKGEFPRDPRTIIKAKPSSFKDAFSGRGNYHVKERNINNTYSFDENNKEVIQQCFLYLTANDKFKGDLQKGILLVGKVGNGKTTIAKILGDIIGICNNIHFDFLPCSELAEITQRNESLDRYYRRPLIMDEIGRESDVVKVYGTQRSPVIEILNKRHVNNAITFATSNFDLSDLGKKYGFYIEDRIKEMFNIIVLSGDSRRV